MKLLVLTAADIEKALPMEQAIEVIAGAYEALSAGRAQAPQRAALATPKGVSLFMPAYLPDRGALSMKTVSVFPDNPQKNLPTTNGLLMLLDHQTGLPYALMDAVRLTALRTGAASGIATRLLAPDGVKVLAMLGAGGQAWDQVRAVCAVRPIEQVRVYTPSGISARALAKRIVSHFEGIAAEAVDEPGLAVRGAQVICAATTSQEPVFEAADVAPGAHINGCGSFTPNMREVPVKGLAKPRIYIDQMEAALAEAGELIQALEQGWLQEEDLIEIGLLISGQAPGRSSAEEITFFKSVGVGAQDAAAAQAVYTHARKLGLGHEVEI